MKAVLSLISRLDELFSPDRLRQNWAIKPEAEPLQCLSHVDIRSKYNELQQLIKKDQPDLSQLSVNLDALTLAINQAFPLEATDCTVDAKQKAIILGLLEHLEELLWASDLSRREMI